MTRTIKAIVVICLIAMLVVSVSAYIFGYGNRIYIITYDNLAEAFDYGLNGFTITSIQANIESIQQAYANGTTADKVMKTILRGTELYILLYFIPISVSLIPFRMITYLIRNAESLTPLESVPNFDKPQGAI